MTGRLDARGVPDRHRGRARARCGSATAPDGKGNSDATSISRVDPATAGSRATVELPDGTAGGISAGVSATGFPQIAVGAGAVWASARRHASRASTRHRPARGDDRAPTRDRIAAGARGRVVPQPDRRGDVTRIDPRTNRVAQTISVGAPACRASRSAAGRCGSTRGARGRRCGGSSPGRRPVTTADRRRRPASPTSPSATGRSGRATTSTARCPRIDPRTNAVTSQVPIGAAQSLAAGAGSAWVSTAGGDAGGHAAGVGLRDVVSGRPRPTC